MPTFPRRRVPIFRDLLRPRAYAALLSAALWAMVCAPPLRAAPDDDITWNAPPYIGATTTDGAVINWVTATPAAGKVAYGRAADRLDQVAAETEPRRIHSVRLTGLKANTRCFFRAEVPGRQEPPGAFWTAPSRGDSFSFVVMGDTRGGHEVHRKVAAQIQKLVPDRRFIFNTGDMIASGTKSEDWKTFFEVIGDLGRSAPYYTCLGNHENNADLYFRLLSLPENGVLPERCYSMEYGGVHLAAFDTNFPWRTDAKQRAWLEADLKSAQTADFRLVFFHHPPHGTQKSRTTDHHMMRILFGRMLARSHADVVFNGHDHHYVRAREEGVNYVLTAGGGAGLYELGTATEYTVLQKKVHHFTRVDYSPGKLKVTAIDVDGQEFDSFTIDRAAAAPAPTAPPGDGKQAPVPVPAADGEGDEF
ncbi:MAG: metallophosphoesterase [Planctomycetes bacterium]|nr:metallophosphoesterase [Planctomycetota bacterium]